MTNETFNAAFSQKSAFAAIRSLGLTVKKTEDGEIRVNFKGHSEETAYYTTDLKDAYDTARSMAALKASSSPKKKCHLCGGTDHTSSQCEFTGEAEATDMNR
jgi:hypothetical protein